MLRKKALDSNIIAIVNNPNEGLALREAIALLPFNGFIKTIILLQLRPTW